MIIEIIPYNWNNRKCWPIFFQTYNFVATRIKGSTMILFPAIKTTPWFCLFRLPWPFHLPSWIVFIYREFIKLSFWPYLWGIASAQACARSAVNEPARFPAKYLEGYQTIGSERRDTKSIHNDLNRDFTFREILSLLWIVGLSTTPKWQNNARRFYLYIFCKYLHWILFTPWLSLHHIWHTWNLFLTMQALVS